MSNQPSELDKTQSAWRWWVCGVLLLATLLNYMDRQALSETATELKDYHHLDDERYGKVERGFSYAFALGSVLFGFLADRFGPRRLYPIVLIGWSGAGIATAFATTPGAIGWLESAGDAPGTGTFHWLLICRTTLGLFEAGHWPCALITARQVLTARDRAFGNSLLQSGASAGAVITPLYVLLVRSLGGSWQVVFWTVGVGGLLWVPLWFLLVRKGDLDSASGGRQPPVGRTSEGALQQGADAPRSPVGGTSEGALQQGADAPRSPVGGTSEGALQQGADAPRSPEAPFDWVGFARRFIVLAVVVTCLGLSWQFIRAWLPKYFKESRGYEPAVSAWGVAFYYIAADIGCIIAGFAVRHLAGRGMSVHGSRVVVFAAWCGLTAVAVVVPHASGSPWVLVPLLMLVGAGILGLHPIYYALAQDLPARHMGLLSGVLAAMTWVTVGTLQGMIGAHIKATGDYTPGFLVAGLAPVVALVVMLVLWKPTEKDLPAG